MWKVESYCFVRHNGSCGLDDPSLEPREKNHMCGSATYAWVWCSVYIFEAARPEGSSLSLFEPESTTRLAASAFEDRSRGSVNDDNLGSGQA